MAHQQGNQRRPVPIDRRMCGHYTHGREGRKLAHTSVQEEDGDHIQRKTRARHALNYLELNTLYIEAEANNASCGQTRIPIGKHCKLGSGQNWTHNPVLDHGRRLDSIPANHGQRHSQVPDWINCPAAQIPDRNIQVCLTVRTAAMATICGWLRSGGKTMRQLVDVVDGPDLDLQRITSHIPTNLHWRRTPWRPPRATCSLDPCRTQAPENRLHQTALHSAASAVVATRRIPPTAAAHRCVKLCLPPQSGNESAPLHAGTIRGGHLWRGRGGTNQWMGVT